MPPSILHFWSTLAGSPHPVSSKQALGLRDNLGKALNWPLEIRGRAAGEEWSPLSRCCGIQQQSVQGGLPGWLAGWLVPGGTNKTGSASSSSLGGRGMKKVPSSIHFEEQSALKINITWDWCVTMWCMTMMLHRNSIWAHKVWWLIVISHLFCGFISALLNYNTDTCIAGSVLGWAHCTNRFGLIHISDVTVDFASSWKARWLK